MTPAAFQTAMKDYLVLNGYKSVLVESDYNSLDWVKIRDRTVAESHLTIIISFSAARPRRRSNMITCVWDIICIVNDKHNDDVGLTVALPVFQLLVNNPLWNYTGIDLATNVERDISDNNYVIYAGGVEATLDSSCT